MSSPKSASITCRMRTNLPVLHFFPAPVRDRFREGVSVPVYKMLPKDKTRGMLRIAEALDNTAVEPRQSPEKGADSGHTRSSVPSRTNC